MRKCVHILAVTIALADMRATCTMGHIEIANFYTLGHAHDGMLAHEKFEMHFFLFFRCEPISGDP